MKIESIMVMNIENNIIKELRKRCEQITYTTSSILFYEGQIPVVAYLIVSGNVHMLKNKKVIQTCSEGSLIGVYELMNNKEANLSANIMPGTRVCFLSKSDLYDILGSDCDLSERFNRLISA